MKISKVKRKLIVLAIMTSLLSACSTSKKATSEEKKFPAVYPKSALTVDNKASIKKKVKALLKAMTQEEKFSLLGGNGTGNEGNAGYLKGVPRLGIPESKMYDGPAGVLYLSDTTNPPIEQLVAATWSGKLAYKYGQIHSSENKAIGGNIQLGSQYDITRSYFFNRAKDQFGEDPYLLRKLAVEETKGIQDENVIAVLKHLAVFSQDATPATNTNIKISEQALHEIHLPGFEDSVTEANALGVMSSYNMVNGTFASSNSYLQNDVLRGMWNFPGFTVTDWGGNDGFTLDKGTTIEMPALSNNSQESAEQKIKDGKITQKTIDKAVEEVLYALGDAGYLGLVKLDDDGSVIVEESRTKAIKLKTDKKALEKAKEKNSKESRKIAQSGGVLLKNENQSLPLDTDKDNTVGVIGLNGMNLISGIGGERSYGTLEKMTSPYDALVNQLGEDKVDGEVGIDIIGEAIPNENLFLSDKSGKHGVQRTFGVAQSEGSSKNVQGQEKTSGASKETKMGDHKVGEDTGIVDKEINFNTGKINNKPNKTYLSKNADEGTANSFPLDSGAAYTWSTYLEAPEDGEYTISLQGIGGTVSGSMTVGDDDIDFGISDVNQGTQWPSDSVVPNETGMSISNNKVTLKKGQRYKIQIHGIAELKEKDLQVKLAWITPSQKKKNYEGALRAAKENKTVVMFAYQEKATLGDSIESSTLALDKDQEDLLIEVAKTAKENNNKVVVVLNNSTPVTMERWIDKVDGLLEMYFPGQEGGTATADLLTGKVNPSGKLAYTIPKKDTDTLLTHSQELWDNNNLKEKGEERDDDYYLAQAKVLGVKTVEEAKEKMASMGMDGTINTSDYSEGIYTGYRWYDEMNIDPQYEFGFGLSYSKFEYTDLSVKPSSGEGEKVGFDVTFEIKNTGDVTGTEIAQVYLGETNVPSNVQIAKNQLAGFSRVENIKPGETRQVTIHVDERSLSYWDESSELEEQSNGTKGKWTVAEGERTLSIGSSSRSFFLQEKVNVKIDK
ncbi:Beta-glucosidase [Enterococcus faecium]|uniref:beta-glucosidase n=1 Tax=Enterococcus faecium TaxID=1352 RepID=UPI000989A6CF|nr:glycoside hydrolase family 3 C-terminal domain-containing protein [Enterococcus faecium]SJX71892.1 Beta-glucosidase [Enterococcus faecium]